jgi:hypothetical protein
VGKLGDDMCQFHGKIRLGEVAVLWTNNMVSCGPVMGYHMAPHQWLMGKSFITPPDSN